MKWWSKRKLLSKWIQYFKIAFAFALAFAFDWHFSERNKPKNNLANANPPPAKKNTQTNNIHILHFMSMICGKDEKTKPATREKQIKVKPKSNRTIELLNVKPNRVLYTF